MLRFKSAYRTYNIQDKVTDVFTGNILGCGAGLFDMCEYNDGIRNYTSGYQFITLLYMPIFPVRCILYRREGIGNNRRINVYADLEKISLEIVCIYLRWWCIPLSIVGSIYYPIFI